jgi:hypothetical protein
MTQSGHSLSRRLMQFERPGYRTLSFGNQLRLALTHKKPSRNESYRGNEYERNYYPILQSFERAPCPISLIKMPL